WAPLPGLRVGHAERSAASGWAADPQPPRPGRARLDGARPVDLESDDASVHGCRLLPRAAPGRTRYAGVWAKCRQTPASERQLLGAAQHRAWQHVESVLNQAGFTLTWRVRRWAVSSWSSGSS